MSQLSKIQNNNEPSDLLSSNLYYYRNVGANFKDENEFKYRYDNQLQATNSLSKRVKELEVELQAANTRYDEMKEKLTKELENEKQLRKETENSSMSRIEEYIKKENELKQQLSNLNIKYGELKLANSDLEKNFEELQESNKMIKNSCENQIKVLNEQIKHKENLLNGNIKALQIENEKICNDSKEEIKKAYADNAKQVDSYEKTIQNLKALKDKYERNNIQLQKEFADPCFSV